MVSSLSLPPVGDSLILNQHHEDGKLLPLDSKNLPNQPHVVNKETVTSDPNVHNVGPSSSCESSEFSRDSDGEKLTNSNADELQWYVTILLRVGRMVSLLYNNQLLLKLTRLIIYLFILA